MRRLRYIHIGRLVVAGSLICSTVLAAGCRKELPDTMPDGRTPLRVYLLLISTRQVEYYKWAEETFEARNPDVDVIIEQFPGSSVKDFEIKLRLRFASRQSPDLFHVNQVLAYDLARKELLAEAPDFIKSMVDSNSVNEFVRQAPYVNGKLYGITADAVWTALYYNREHFREAGLDPDTPPGNWDELLDYAEKLTLRREDGTPYRSGFSIRKTGFKPGIAEKWFTFLVSSGGVPFAENGTETRFLSDEGREAIGFYNDVLFERRIDDVSLEGDEPGFAEGMTSMFFRESYVIRLLQENYPDVDFGVAPIPANSMSSTVGGAYLFSVSAQSTPKRQDAAWRFARFLMNDEAYERYVAIGGVMPATKSIAGLPQFADDPHLNVFLEQHVTSVDPFPDYSRAVDIIGAYIEKFCYGQLSSEDALRRASEDIDALLKRHKST